MTAGKGRPVFILNKAVAANLLALNYIVLADTRGERPRYVVTQAGREAIEDADAEPGPRRRSAS